ncbi:MAG: glycosyltransferase family 1 protein [Chitinophagia bacterium]|nr:glycosyltransferase family 1 protein [Chitinophagia bacterium]
MFGKYWKFLTYNTDRLVRKLVLQPAYNAYVAVRKATARPTPPYSVVILDDTAPNLLTSYRTHEFTHHLDNIPGSALYSIISFSYVVKKYFDHYSIESLKQFKKYRSEFIAKYPYETNRIQPFQPWTILNTKLVYVVFLNNAYNHIDYFEKHNIKFLLELYPGGGFCITTDDFSYEKLKRVLTSPSLATVFTTQRISYEFITQQNFCDPSKIIHYFGGILTKELFGMPDHHVRYPEQKQTIDVCFAANKYTPRGEDKGYDIFIESAIKVLETGDEVFRFHIIGGFSDKDIPIPAAYRHKFIFKGHIKFYEFRELYKDKDIFISPSRPYILAKGAFDGFPTTTTAEASLNGLCILLSDPLNLNELYENGRDAMILENDPEQFAAAMLALKADPARMYQMGQMGKQACYKVDPDTQLAFRTNLIKKHLT